MRISTSQSHRLALERMQAQQNQVARAQDQIATGRRINTAADDPSAMAQSLALDARLAQSAAWQSNITVARHRLSLTDTALDSAGDTLNRMRELAVQANNATQSPESRAAIVSELVQLRELLIGVANTGDGQGRYLFGGSQDAAPPFADGLTGVSYAGDQSVSLVDIGDARSIALNDPGSEVFQRLPGGDLFDTAAELVRLAGLSAGDPTRQAGFAAALSRLDSAQQHFADLRGSLGNRLAALDDAEGVLGATDVHAQTALSELRDLDYAEAVSRLQQHMTILQAAQQTYVRVQGLSLFDFLR